MPIIDYFCQPDERNGAEPLEAYTEDPEKFCQLLKELEMANKQLGEAEMFYYEADPYNYFVKNEFYRAKAQVKWLKRSLRELIV